MPGIHADSDQSPGPSQSEPESYQAFNELSLRQASESKSARTASGIAKGRCRRVAASGLAGP
jgi:hypothetical protein